MNSLNITPNPVEPYIPENYTTLTKDDITIVKTPEEVDDLHAFRKTIRTHIINSGSYYLSPFGFNWNNTSEIYSALSVFKEFTNSVSLSSCRIDAIARDPGLAKLVQHFGSTSLTVAIEGISQRLRDWMQKSLTQEDLYVGINHILSSGFQSLKLYYIYTGLETEQDLNEFEDFLKLLSELKLKYNRPNHEIRVNITPLVSTLGTPSQYHGSLITKASRGIDGAVTLHQIKIICGRYGVAFRASASLGAAELTQILEMADRRFQGLLEYASLCGVQNFPTYTVNFYKNPIKVSLKEFKTLPIYSRITMDGELFKVDHNERITINRLYEYVNADNIEPEISIHQLLDELKQCQGKEASILLTKNMNSNRQERFKGSKVYLQEYLPEECFVLPPKAKYIPAGVNPDPKFRIAWEQWNTQYAMLCNTSASLIQADQIKRLLPLFTGGVTYNEICSDKPANYIFPGMHIQIHKNQHLGTHYRQYKQNKSGLRGSYCLNLHKCLECGKCNTNEDIKFMTTIQKKTETGETHFHLIENIQKSSDAAEKLLIEVRIKDGRWSAMKPDWLRHAIVRALLKTSELVEIKNKWGVDLVTPLVYERFIHSRQGYKLNKESFKSLLSGSFIQEITFNKGVLSDKYIKDIKDQINQFTTDGWEITNLKIQQKTFNLVSSLQYSAITFTFDNRVGETKVSIQDLQKAIERFLNTNSKMKYRSQVSKSRFYTKIEQVDFDKSNVIALGASVKNQYESTLRVILKTEGTHPFLWLTGFLGTDDKAKSIAPLGSVKTRIEGFYTTGIKKKDTKTTDKSLGSVFDSVESTSDSITCPRCQGSKLINIMTGLPFGNSPEVPHEQSEFTQYSLSNTTNQGSTEYVCQSCWTELMI